MTPYSPHENNNYTLSPDINEVNYIRRSSDIPHFNSSLYPNFIFTNYNREFNKCLFGEKSTMHTRFSDNESTMIKTMITDDHSYKIVDMLDKMKNLMNIVCKDSSVLFYESSHNSTITSTNADKIMSSSQLYSKNSVFEDLDLRNINNLMFDSYHKPEFLKKTMLENMDIENIQKGCFDLRELIRSNTDEMLDNEMPIQNNTTKNSVNQIIQNSEKVIELYNKLFQICLDSLNDISTIANDLGEKDTNIYKSSFTFNNDERKAIKDSFSKELVCKGTNIIEEKLLPHKKDAVIQNKDKEESIKDKIEKLRILKEKKEQLLNRFSLNETSDNLLKDTVLLKIQRRNTILSEIEDNSFNENVFIKIPRSTFMEVKKPTDGLNNIKLYKPEVECFFNNDSHILINFDSLKNQYEIDIQNMEKELLIKETDHYNDTVLDISNAIIKNHKRSKSHLIKDVENLAKPKFLIYLNLGFLMRIL